MPHITETALQLLKAALVHDLDTSACQLRAAHQEALSPCQRRLAEYGDPCPACVALAALKESDPRAEKQIIMGDSQP